MIVIWRILVAVSYKFKVCTYVKVMRWFVSRFSHLVAISKTQTWWRNTELIRIIPSSPSYLFPFSGFHVSFELLYPAKFLSCLDPEIMLFSPIAL